jgi:hypothetical protein
MSYIRRCLLAGAAGLSPLVLAGAAQAKPEVSHQLCVPVFATGVGQDLGTDKLGNDMTEATLSSHGVVLGTTHATFTPTSETATSESFAGPIVFSSDVGTLTAQVTGHVDITGTPGAFSVNSTSITGTRLLRGVSGQVTLNGDENLSTGAFTETITGRLCVG